MGNPGKEYEQTPHNAGFFCIDELCRRFNTELGKGWRYVIYQKLVHDGQQLVLAKPISYMNLSGIGLQKLQNEIPFDLSDMLVIYDDIDLPLGSVRIRAHGSAGTHKGMKSIIKYVGSGEFPRVRIGIQPRKSAPADIVSYVLTPLRGKAFSLFKEGICRAADAVEAIIHDGISPVMNRFNRKANSLLLRKGEAAKP